MGFEIEKKYLVNKIPFDLENFQRKEIIQSYISTDPIIRLRKIDDNYVLTVKGDGHIKRQEFELMLTKEQYISLILKTENLTIKKTRYFIQLSNNLVAELDIYHDNLKDLVTVEVEFSSMEDANKFSPPHWFGDDVSQNTRYKNSFLSKYGYKK